VHRKRLPTRFLLGMGVLTALALPVTAQDRPGRGGRAGGSAPQVGERAPTFELATLDGKAKVNLETFRGKKPVVLIFGSYT